MVQDILVIFILAATSARIIFSLRKFWLKRKATAITCGGCGHCSLKKNIARHGQH